MQSPPVEWTLGIGYLALLDYLRSRGDEDGDTLSEVIRDGVRRHPRGEQAFTVVLFAGAFVLRRHILGALRAQRRADLAAALHVAST